MRYEFVEAVFPRHGLQYLKRHLLSLHTIREGIVYYQYREVEIKRLDIPTLCHFYWTRKGEQVILMLRQDPANKGRSVCNALEVLVNEFCQEHQVNPEQLRVLEQNPDNLKEYSDVKLQQVSIKVECGQVVNAGWGYISLEEAQALLGHPLPVTGSQFANVLS